MSSKSNSTSTKKTKKTNKPKIDKEIAKAVKEMLD